MSAVWLIFAFAAGWLSCWWFSKFLLKHVLGRPSAMTKDIIAGLKQETLVKTYNLYADEIEKRKKGLTQ